jgi:chromosome partitioning protein
MKGGVGKTTIAVNIAGALAKLRNKRVLLVDLDPQYNATQYLVDVERKPDFVNGKSPTVFDILSQGQVAIPDLLTGKPSPQSPGKDVKLSDVARTLFSKDSGRLDLIPGTIHLIRLELARWGIEHQLENFLHDISEAYDFVFVDCPPTFGVYLLSGFLACDHYVIPVKPDFLSVLGITLLEEVIRAYSKAYRKEAKPLGVVFTMVRKTREMDRVRDLITSTSAGKRYIFDHFLSYSTYAAEATRVNKMLFEYSKAWKNGQQIIEITDELLGLL